MLGGESEKTNENEGHEILYCLHSAALLQRHRCQQKVQALRLVVQTVNGQVHGAGSATAAGETSGR